jgi:L-amino acid N-acyltransferase YncA
MTRTQIRDPRPVRGAPAHGGSQDLAAHADCQAAGAEYRAAHADCQAAGAEYRAAGAEYRAARAADCEAIRSFLAGLSPRTRLLRFFTPVSPPSSAVLRAMCGVDGTADVLVATHGGAIVAHAMAADSTSPGGCRAADIGVVVADDWQDRGVGSEILDRLIARAAARAVRVLVMDVLPENGRMLAMISRRWPDAACEYAAGAVSVRVRLPEAAAGADGACGGTAPRAA